MECGKSPKWLLYEGKIEDYTGYYCMGVTHFYKMKRAFLCDACLNELRAAGYLW